MGVHLISLTSACMYIYIGPVVIACHELCNRVMLTHVLKGFPPFLTRLLVDSHNNRSLLHCWDWSSWVSLEYVTDWTLYQRKTTHHGTASTSGAAVFWPGTSWVCQHAATETICLLQVVVCGKTLSLRDTDIPSDSISAHHRTSHNWVLSQSARQVVVHG